MIESKFYIFLAYMLFFHYLCGVFCIIMHPNQRINMY